jgi:hypothetical protein
MKLSACIFGLLFIALFSNCVLAANDDALDTIIKVEGKVMPVDVIKVTPQYVRFLVPGNNEVFTIPRKEVHKIIYKDGRIDELNRMAFATIDETSWEAIWLTEDAKEVLELYKRGEISAQSPPSARSPQAAKKSAIIRMQKKAAAMKGSVILVTKKQATGGYGEFPGYYVEGAVYGTEPPTEVQTDKDIL